MWRWSILVVVISLCKHNSSQPIADSENDRSPRQLDFEECCPCLDKNYEEMPFDNELSDSLGDGTENIFSSMRDLDNCPCRFQDADTEGASSIFFPTATRSAGNVLRTNGKKDSPKPLFNPEVGLASSVLETLKEVTDEEYKNALARDAAKSIANAADDYIFEDATPQESANIVTIVVKPKNTDNDDDIDSETSHIQQSRCIHPIESSRTYVGKTAVLPKSNLISQRSRVPKKRTGILHRRFNNMDSYVDATNTNEELMLDNVNIEDIETDPSEIKISTDRDANDYSDFSKGKTTFQLAHVQNKLRDLTESSLLQRDETVNSLKRAQEETVKDWIPEISKNYKVDLNPASSNIYEEDKVPYTRMNSLWSNSKEKSSPLSLTNLLNLRDVEIIPLKELVTKHVENGRNKKLKSLFSSLSNQRDMQNTQKHNDTSVKPLDLKESSSLLSVQIISNDEPIEENKWHSNVDTNNNFKRILDDVGRRDRNCNQIENKSSDELMIDSRNDVNKIAEEVNPTQNFNQSFEDNQSLTLESYSDTNESQDSTNIHDIKSKTQFGGISIGDTVLNIKENIAKQLKHLKTIRSSINNKIKMDQKAYISDLENSHIPDSRNTMQTEENEVLIQSTTVSSIDIKNNEDEIAMTTKPNLSEDNIEGSEIKFHHNIINDNVGASTKYDSVEESRLYDLQQLSDSLLQQAEYEQVLEPKSEMDDEKFVTSKNINQSENTEDLSDLVDNSVEIVKNPDNLNPFEVTNNEVKGHINDLSKTAAEQQCPIDSNVEASKITMNIVPAQNNIISVESQTEHNFLKKSFSGFNDVLNIAPFKPLPTLDDIKVKLANIFDKEVNRFDLDRDGSLQAEKIRNIDKPGYLKEKNIEDSHLNDDAMKQESVRFGPVSENTEDASDLVDKPVEIIGNPDNLPPFEVTNNEANDYINDLTETMEEQQCPMDSNVEASKITMNIVPAQNNVISAEPQTEHIFLKNSFADINDVLNIAPLRALHTLDDIKVKLANIFDKEVNRLDMDKDGSSKAEQVRDLNKPDYLKEKSTEDSHLNNDNIVIDPKDKLRSQVSFLKERQPTKLNDVFALGTHDNMRLKLIHDEDNQSEIRSNLKKCDDSQEADLIDTAEYDKINEEDNTKKDIVISETSPSINGNISTGKTIIPKRDDVNILQQILHSQLRPLKDSVQYFNNMLNIPNPEPLQTFVDIKESLINLFDKKNRDANTVDIGKANHVQEETEETKKFNDFKEQSSEDINCKSDFILPKVPISDILDTDVRASNIALNIIPKDYKNLGSPALQPEFSLLKETSLAPAGVLEPLLEPITTLDNMKIKSNTFLGDHRDIEVSKPIKALESRPVVKTIDILNPVMVTEDSSLEARVPASKIQDKGDVVILQPTSLFGMQQSAPKSNLHLPKPKFTLPNNFNLKSMNLLSPLDFNEDLKIRPLGQNDCQFNTEISNIQSNKNVLGTLNKPLNIKPNFNSITEPHLDSPVEATNKIYYTLKSSKSPLDAKLNHVTNNKMKILRKPISKSSSIFDTISRNHEEFNERLKSMHTDFNDRLESIRNDLIDRSKLLGSGSRNMKPQFKSSNNFDKQNKSKQSFKKPSSALNSRQSIKSLVPRKPLPYKFIKTGSLPHTESKKFRMPTAASIPIPKTVEVPELKTVPTKLSPLSLQKASLKVPSWKTEVFHPKESSGSFGSQSTNLKNTNIPFQKPNSANKKSTIKVSFSTTIRPTMSTENTAKNSSLTLKDYNRLSSPIDIPSKNLNELKSWPRATESSFLSKVKDAIQARLSMKSPIGLKQSKLRSDNWQSSRANNFDSDMTRAASDNKDIIDESLKENVSYKCKMVCGKEA